MTVKFPVTLERVTMYDSVNAASLPAATTKAAGYINGSFPSHDAIVKRFPAARVFAIDVLGTAWEGASVLDYEEGNPAYMQSGRVRGWINGRNDAFPQTACIYCAARDIDQVEEYAAGLWHVLWVASWGMNGAAGKSLTGTRTAAGNLIVATQVQNNAKANWDMSDTLPSWC